MTISPYNISESTKIAKAYLKNVVDEASVKWGSDAVDLNDGSTDILQSNIQSTALDNFDKSSDDNKNPYNIIINDKHKPLVNDIIPTTPLDAPPKQSKPSFWERFKNAKGGTMGDIVNAGYSSMVMGSPFATRPYKPGTNELKSSEELQREQKNSVIAGAIGAAVLNPAVAAKLGSYALNGYGIYELGKSLFGDTASGDTASGDTTPYSDNKSDIGLTAAMIAAPIAGYAIAKYGMSLGKAIKKPKNNIGKNFVIVNNGKYLNSEGFSSSITKDTIVFTSIKSAQNTINALNSVNKGDYTIKELDTVIR